MTPSHRAPPLPDTKTVAGGPRLPGWRRPARESGRRAIFRYFTYFLERSRASYVSVLTTTETDQPRAARGWSVVSTMTTLSMSGSRSLTGHRTATAHRARGPTHSSAQGGAGGGADRGGAAACGCALAGALAGSLRSLTPCPPGPRARNLGFATRFRRLAGAPPDTAALPLCAARTHVKPYSSVHRTTFSYTPLIIQIAELSHRPPPFALRLHNSN